MAAKPGGTTMSIASRPTEASPAGAFARQLREWRQRRRLPQLELALQSGVSQRHISFLESGRARPSREMVLQLSETLDVPLRERNDWLIAAGFAPVYRVSPLEDPRMAQVRNAIHLMLSNHAPFPAVAIDRGWNILMTNPAFEMMLTLLGDELWTRVGGEQRNLMRLCFHRDGIRPYVKNWAEVAPVLWHRATREADTLGGQGLHALLEELRPHQEWQTLHPRDVASLVPVLPLEIEKGGVCIALFSVIATFGTPQDVTADEVRIESFFPADAPTEALFRAASPG